ncbi:MAG: beta-galactosidase [Clostridia bacterium]|nr:beta-galactosidase [Clostridia bacterium]
MKRVVLKNGNLCLEVDGKTVAPVAYMSYLPARANYDEFHKIGYELFSACIYMGDMPINEISGVRPFGEHIWKSRDVFDFSPLDKTVKQALGESLSGYLLLRINVNVPRWWREENPDELVKFGNGKTFMQSSFSEKWIQDVQIFFDKLKAHIQSAAYANNVIAWQIAAMNTEEWISPIDNGSEPDFSVCAQKAFASWCKRRYGKVEALNKAWGTALLAFSDVEIPTMAQRESYNQDPLVDERKHAQTLDFYRCFNQSYATAIERLSAYVKEIFNGDIFVGTFYGYIGQLGVNSGHCALSKLLHSEHIDFFASPFTYTAGRKSADDWFYHSAMQSCKAAGKLWFMEADVRTWKTKALCEVDPTIVGKDNERMLLPVWFGPQTEEQSIWDLTRVFGKVLTSGNAFWWFDMWGGWYDTPRTLEFMHRAKEIYQSALSKSFRSVAEVAVVLDEEAAYGMNIHYGGQACFLQMLALGNTGSPYDLYLKGDCTANDLSAYKCVVYVAPFTLTDFDRETIATLDKTGKTVLLTGKPFDIGGNHVHAIDKPLTENELRAYYRTAGVHAYIEKTGLLVANADFVGITAADDSAYELHMPKDCVLQDAFTGETYETRDNKITLSMQKMQSKLFMVGTKG